MIERTSVAARLGAIARSLIDQQTAQVIIEPMEDRQGFWFGGGNMIELDDHLVIVGRFRNAGDSTTGLRSGERGLELAIFRSRIAGVKAENWRSMNFEKVVSFTKDDLSLPGRTVVSIEGTALTRYGADLELYVSTEKLGIDYPSELAEYQKRGTGCWSIDRMSGNELESLGKPQPILNSTDPRYLHVKDPSVHHNSIGDTVLTFCTHPFNWASANSGVAIRKVGETEFGDPSFDLFPRGFTWDVASARITDIVTIPPDIIGTATSADLVFYDGAECVRPHDENPMGVSRPRGYSCEELGAAAWYPSDFLEQMDRIETVAPMFVSPWGTGCSRYVHTLACKDGIYATWQQSQRTGSQPLVMNFRSWDRLRAAADSI